MTHTKQPKKLVLKTEGHKVLAKLIAGGLTYVLITTALGILF